MTRIGAMTRIGRIVAGVGAVVGGLVALVVTTIALHALTPDPRAWVALAEGLLGFVVFGVTTAALYTWTVDGPFVRSRRR
jgi:hypothetical protein